MYNHGNPEMKFASLFEACEYLEGISQVNPDIMNYTYLVIHESKRGDTAWKLYHDNYWKFMPSM